MQDNNKEQQTNPSQEQKKAPIQEATQQEQQSFVTKQESPSPEVKENHPQKAEQKSQEESGEKHEISHKQKDDEVISLTDITQKAKKLFSKKKKTSLPTQKQEKEQFNFAQVTQYTKKNAKWLIPLAFLLVVLFISSSLRYAPSHLTATDGWAESTVTNFYRNQVESQIAQKYPNLPPQNRQALIDKEFQSLLANNPQYIQEIEQVSNQFKNSFQDENQDTYLLAIDPYLWYSQARNVVNHGHLGDTRIDGKSYFSLRDGRLPKESSVQLHPYIAAYTYKFLSLLHPGISLMRALFLLPILLIGLAIFPTFFIGRRLAGNVGGFFAALFFVINVPLLGRTLAGFSDTDAYNVLLPLFVVWVAFEAYQTRKYTHKLLFSALGGFLVGVYATAWSGWSHIFLLVLGVLIGLPVLQVLTTYIKQLQGTKLFAQNSLKDHLSMLGIYLVSSALFISWFKTFATFVASFSRPIRFITLKSVGVKSIWPNVLTTVAEFNTTSFSTIINHIGGKLLFWFAITAVALLLVNYKKLDKINLGYLGGAALYNLLILSFIDSVSSPVVFIALLAVPLVAGIVKVYYLKEKVAIIYPVLLLLWFLASAYAFTKGARFALLIAPSAALLIGVALGRLYAYVSEQLTKGLKVRLYLSRVLVFAVLLLFAFAPYSAAKQTSESAVPSMNDAWYGLLTKIKDASADAIITSWWDFGHWFVAISERRVTFDGGDQGERIHWVGKSLLTDNEQESIGVLRMLNCAQETAPHKLEEFGVDSLEATRIINKVILTTDRSTAQQIYTQAGLTLEQTATMLEMTHCQDLIDNYFIASEDMVGKAGVWGHFGSWDFERASMYFNTNKLSRPEAVTYLTKNFGMTEQEASQVHSEIQTTSGDQWISGWPNYLSGLVNCQTQETTLLCVLPLQGRQLGATIDLTTQEVTFEGNPGIVPNSLVYAQADEIVKKEFTGEKIGFSLVLLQKGESYAVVMATPQQAASQFTKLFFFEGLGQKCFKLFDGRQQVTGQKIYTYMVDYTCSQ